MPGVVLGSLHVLAALLGAHHRGGVASFIGREAVVLHDEKA